MACSTFDFLNAAAYGTADEVRVMLDSGIDVNVRNEGSRETALMTAAGGGNIDTVKSNIVSVTISIFCGGWMG
jgi:ankyrin repeat protein